MDKPWELWQKTMFRVWGLGFRVWGRVMHDFVYQPFNNQVLAVKFPLQYRLPTSKYPKPYNPKPDCWLLRPLGSLNIGDAIKDMFSNSFLGLSNKNSDSETRNENNRK